MNLQEEFDHNVDLLVEQEVHGAHFEELQPGFEADSDIDVHWNEQLHVLGQEEPKDHLQEQQLEDLEEEQKDHLQE